MQIENFNYCQQAIEIKNKTEVSFLQLGEYLFNIREQRLYEGQWDTFHNFLEEMNLQDSTASKLISVYRKFIFELNIPKENLLEAGGWTKLAKIVNVIETPEDADEWLAKSSVLSMRDLEKEIKENKTGVEMKTCRHDNTYLVEICKDCGEKWERFDK